MEIFDNLNSGSEEEAVDAFMSHLDEAEPKRPTDEAGDEGEATPDVDVEAEGAEPDDETEAESADSSETSEDAEQEPQRFTVKVNGEEKEVTLEDLRNGFMMHADYTQKTTRLSEQQKEFEAKSAERFQYLDQRLSELDALIDGAEKGINWEELRELDPGEYLRQREMQQKRVEARDAARKEQAERQKQFLEQYKAEEAEKLQAALPEWLDADTRKQDIGEMRKTLETLGFSQKEIGSFLDHRLIRLAHMAAKGQAALEKLEKRQAEAKRQVEKAPPLQKPKSNGGKTPQEEKRRALAAKARRGDIDAAAAWFEMDL